MPDLDNEEWNSQKPLSMVAKIASIQSSLLVVGYGYHDIARLIKVRDEDETEDEDATEPESEEEDMVEAKSDDPLAEVLIDSLNELESTTREGGLEIDVSPKTSVAQLFKKGSEQRDGKPRLWLVFDIADDEAKCVGSLTGLKFRRDANLLSERFTSAYLTQHKLPRNLGQYLWIDVVSAKRKPAGMLLLLNAFLYSSRSKDFRGIAFAAVTKKGVQIGTNYGMHQHTYKEDGATRHLMYLANEEVDLKVINKKLKLGNANNFILESLCSRAGLQERTRHRVIPRC